MNNMMFQTADVYRPSYTQGVGQTVSGYSRVYRSVPCSIQPASSQLQWYYEQRGSTVTHTIYTTRTDLIFAREDVLVYGGHEYHITAAPMNGLELGYYIELQAEQYPEGAKLRLDMEAYG